MKKLLLKSLALFLVAVMAISVVTSCGNGDTSDEEKGTDGLDFYPLPDDTYGVMAGITKYLDNIVIPSKHKGKAVTQILPEAFLNAENLVSITIPDSVTSIGDDAFYNCDELTSIDIPDRVTSIGSSAFRDCTGLTSVTIGNGVESIGNRAFLNCTRLTSIVIPDSVTSIGDEAFSYCTGLTSIDIPDSVKSIGDLAFAYCIGLTSIKFRGTEAEWNVIEKGSSWNKNVSENCQIIFDYTGE